MVTTQTTRCTKSGNMYEKWTLFLKIAKREVYVKNILAELPNDKPTSNTTWKFVNRLLTRISQRNLKGLCSPSY